MRTPEEMAVLLDNRLTKDELADLVRLMSNADDVLDDLINQVDVASFRSPPPVQPAPRGI